MSPAVPRAIPCPAEPWPVRGHCQESQSCGPRSPQHLPRDLSFLPSPPSSLGLFPIITSNSHPPRVTCLPGSTEGCQTSSCPLPLHCSWALWTLQEQLEAHWGEGVLGPATGGAGFSAETSTQVKGKQINKRPRAPLPRGLGARAQQ